MDIDQHVNQIVQNIVTEITTQVQAKALEAIDARIQEVISAIDVTPLLAERLNEKLDQKLSRLDIDSKTIEKELAARVDNLSTNLSKTVETRVVSTAVEGVSQRISKINFQELCQTAILGAFNTGSITFPDMSIPASAVNFSNVSISGKQIKGGIIEQFGSTGIDDQATGCQLSIFDEVTVIENNLLTKDLTVKGNTTIEGDLVVSGSVPKDSAFYGQLVESVSATVKTQLNEVVFDSYANMVFDRIKTNGLDLNKIKMNGVDIVDGGNLSNHITFSNLQKVGTLHELRVRGEALLSDAIYTSNKRVGINTLEPNRVLSIWDQEVEIAVSKKELNVGIIETPRNQSLILSSNGKNNLSLNTDGSVSVNSIDVGAVTLSSSGMPPSTDAKKGTVVFNANPTLGGPLGWVSLGDSRWANFGFID